MKFSIEKSRLSLLTAIVNRAAAHRSTIPALSGVMINLNKENGITLTATDMEISIVANDKNVDIIEDGQVLVNAAYFSDFIKLLPEGDVLVELSKEKAVLEVYYGKSKGQLNIYNEEDYPELPLQEARHIFSLKSSDLREALKRTVLAAAVNHYRQIFNGVLFDVQADKNILNTVASDTHRLALYSQKLPSAVSENINFIVPLRTVQELLRLLADDSDVEISVLENNVIFTEKDRFILYSRLISGNYPNYDAVIPKESTTEFNINPKLLTNALERSKVIPITDKFQIPSVNLSLAEREIKLNTASETMGEINEVLDNIDIAGDSDFTIAFNTGYFLDIAKLLAGEAEQMNIKLSGALGPALMKNPDNANYLYVLVPLRTSN